jgi:Zn-finger nucleic acid-binding protein
MRCPAGSTEMRKSKRDGINGCPQRRGVWLHRGEFEKVGDRAAIAARTLGSARSIFGIFNF